MVAGLASNVVSTELSASTESGPKLETVSATLLANTGLVMI